ncbi:MAG: hypothetical protein ABEK50_00290, partial [bacterium]
MAAAGVCLAGVFWLIGVWYPSSGLKLFGQGLAALTALLMLIQVGFFLKTFLNLSYVILMIGVALGPFGVLLTMASAWFTMQLSGAFLVFASCLFTVIWLTAAQLETGLRKPGRLSVQFMNSRMVPALLLILVGTVALPVGLTSPGHRWPYYLTSLGGLGFVLVVYRFVSCCWRVNRTVESSGVAQVKSRGSSHGSRPS